MDKNKCDKFCFQKLEKPHDVKRENTIFDCCRKNEESARNEADGVTYN